MTAAHLIYPLRQEQNALHLILTRKLHRLVPAGSFTQGEQLVGAINALHRAERHARALTPFDPTGL